MRFAFLPATALLFCSTLSCGFPALAQDRRNDNNQFYNGARRGAHGGNYGGGNYHHGNDQYYDNRNQGGIGPGKGAAIGGAAGAVLGFAKAWHYEQAVAALATMSGVKISTLDRLLSGARSDTDDDTCLIAVRFS